MDINVEMLKARASDVEQAVRKIREYTALPESVFWDDERNMFAVKYLLLQAMEAVGSICVHVLARRFQIPATSYAACFEQLAKENVLPPELSGKLRKMIRFRNLLTHRYWEIDDRRVAEYARQDVQDLTEMLKAVWRFLHLDGRNIP